MQNRESVIDLAIHMFAVRMDLAIIWISTALDVVDLRLARSWRPVYACLAHPPDTCLKFPLPGWVNFRPEID